MIALFIAQAKPQLRVRWGQVFIFGVFSCLSEAVRDDADGGAVQPHKGSYLSVEFQGRGDGGERAKG